MFKVEIDFDFRDIHEKRWFEDMLNQQIKVVARIFEARSSKNKASVILVSHKPQK